MYTFTHITKKIIRHTHLLQVSVVIAIFALYAFGIPVMANESTPATCTMSSNTSVLASGSVTTLSWNITGGEFAYVTIDRFPGQSFARSGSVEVTPAETTTYTASAEGGAQHISCSTTITVHNTPAPTCDPATLTVSGSTFTWKGCPDMERYEATFCDGTSVGPVYGDWSGEKTIDLERHIASVRACGDDCDLVASQTCPSVTYPACPFVASADTKVVLFDKTRLYSNSTIESEYKTRMYPVSLAQGVYKVETASWDGYVDRAYISQPSERWFAELTKGGTMVARTGATTDLADNVVDAFKNETVNERLSVTGPVDSVYAQHASYYDAGSYNSVFPVCVAFTALSDPEAPSCTLTLTPTSITSGGSATLSWSGVGVTGGTIDQGVGTTSASGSVSVSPNSNTTYTGTFTKSTGGTVSCSATLAVGAIVTPPTTVAGGGGSCLNCDDTKSSGSTSKKKSTTSSKEKDEVKKKEKTPNVVLASIITAPGNGITLDQVPYTGFEAGPLVTVFFWGAILALSILVAHVLTHTNVLSKVRYTLATIRNGSQPQTLVSTERMTPHTVLQTPSVTTPAVLTRQQVPGVADDDGAGKIENAAHAHNILLSPEATRMIMSGAGGTHGAIEDFLDALFEKAISMYPREDGWILVSRERAEALLEATKRGVDAVVPAKDTTNVLSTSHDDRPHRMDFSSVSSHVAPMVAPSHAPVSHNTYNTTVEEKQSAPVQQVATREAPSPSRTEVDALGAQAVPLFVELIIIGDQQKTYDLLRRLLTKGVTPEMFIAGVIRKLDDIYKNRLEGNHNPDKELATKTAMWSNADFETVLGMLVECVDYSYSNSKIGTKIALAKVFAYFAHK